MTKTELKLISSERYQITLRLAVLDGRNSIEAQEINRHIHRLLFLKQQIDRALVATRRNRLRIIA